MMLSSFEPKPLTDVTVGLELHKDTLFLELLGKRYADFRSPFRRAEIEQLLEDYSPNRVANDPLVSFGSTLFSALFAGERGRVLWELLDQVTCENRALRLRIKTNVERIQHLPWELLYDGSRGDFVSLSGRVALVRTRPDVFHHDVVLTPLPRLRILVATADPHRQLHFTEDLSALEALVHAHPEWLELHTLREATCAALTKTLEKEAFDIFVFLGDGKVLPEVSKSGGVPQAVQLVPEGKDDLGQLNRNQLGQHLASAGVRLALLVGNDTDWVARSLAKHIPASIGFRQRMRRESRSVVVDALFRAFLAGMPLDLAVTSVRQAIDRAEPGTGEWCRLIFYLQPPDGSFLLAPLPPAKPVPPQYEPPAGLNRELAKLVRLRDVYRTNLEELQRAGLAGGAEDWRKQAEALREKLDAITQRIDHAAHDGKDAS